MLKPLLVACLMLTCAGCETSGKEPLRRSLPATATIVPAKVPVPPPRVGDDAKTALAENMAVAAENGRRLEAARRNYEAVRKDYNGER